MRKKRAVATRKLQTKRRKKREAMAKKIKRVVKVLASPQTLKRK